MATKAKAVKATKATAVTAKATKAKAAPAKTKPAKTKPATTKAAKAKPAKAKPATTKPATAKAVEAKPARAAKAKAPAKPVGDRQGSSEAKARFQPVYDALIGRDGVGERAMFGAQSLNLAGKAFAMLYKNQLVVKLSKARVAAYVADGTGVPWDPGHGRTMKEWLGVPLSSPADWLALAREALAHVAT